MGDKKSLTRQAIENTERRRLWWAKVDEIANELDPIVREGYKNDPVKLAEWEEVMRPDTAPRRSKRAERPVPEDGR
jgi:hypothetical protein